MIAVLLHGFRAKEARLMPLRCVILPTYQERGHFTISEESRTKRGTRGVRDVPMDPDATEVLRKYVRFERPDYIGTGEEPLFVTISGRAFTANGWNAMAQRLKRKVKAETRIDFKQHRFRSTRTRLLHEEGWPDSAIIEVQGWSDGSGYRMLRRYRGRIPTSQLQRYPKTLGRFFGRAV
jgi:integrase